MMPTPLHILSGGAAAGLLHRLLPAFEEMHGCRINGTYGAVGLMKEKLVAGDLCDVLILTDALIRQLAAEDRVDAASARPVGVVKTGLAVKQGAPQLKVDSPEDLRLLLERAGSIYFPDPTKATAGIHFMKVLESLGLAGTLGQRLRTFPNGAAAMAALAEAPEANAVGCTQVTEILFTEGVRLTGLLPTPHELATTYTAAVATGADQPELARELIAALTAAQAAQARRECGFE
ncbi:MAG: periplasmic component of an type molybdate transport system-like protein [Ramlibacter sp.]|nr:periplasmic component of an type molybdate transport system-like protein [Ramlibacter sp.]